MTKSKLCLSAGREEAKNPNSLLELIRILFLGGGVSFYLQDCQQIFSQIIVLKSLGDGTQLPPTYQPCNGEESIRHSKFSMIQFLASSPAWSPLIRFFTRCFNTTVSMPCSSIPPYIQPCSPWSSSSFPFSSELLLTLQQLSSATIWHGPDLLSKLPLLPLLTVLPPCVFRSIIVSNLSCIHTCFLSASRVVPFYSPHLCLSALFSWAPSTSISRTVIILSHSSLFLFFVAISEFHKQGYLLIHLFICFLFKSWIWWNHILNSSGYLKARIRAY